MHMIRKGQFTSHGTATMSFAGHFMRWRDWPIQHKPGLDTEKSA